MENTKSQMWMKKSAFIPGKFGKENATGLLPHNLEINLSTQKQVEKTGKRRGEHFTQLNPNQILERG